MFQRIPFLKPRIERSMNKHSVRQFISCYAPSGKAVVLPNAVDHHSVVVVDVLLQPAEHSGRISINRFHWSEGMHLELQLPQKSFFRTIQRRDFKMNTLLTVAIGQLPKTFGRSSLFERQRIDNMQNSQRRVHFLAVAYSLCEFCFATQLNLSILPVRDETFHRVPFFLRQAAI